MWKISNSNNTIGGLRAGLLVVSLAGSTCLAGPLDDFARNNGGTSVQVDIATAIQAICPSLVGSFGGIDDALGSPDSPDKDITLRCNELISTSVGMATGTQPRRSLGYDDPDELLGALQQVTGEEIAAQNTMTVRAANSQFSNIASRLGALRLASSGAGTTGPASAFNFDVGGVNMTSAVADTNRKLLGGGASADETGGLQRAGFFINGNYNTGDRDASALEDGFDFDVFSVTAGLDYRFDSGVIGASVGYDDFSSDFKSSAVVSGGDIGADGFSVSLFGLKDLGNFFVDGIATYGELDYEMSRILIYSSANNDPGCQCPNQDRTLGSSSSGDHIAVSSTAGWQWYANEWLIQPTLGVSWRSYTIDGYTEVDTQANGGMELRYGDQDIDSLRSVLGIQISRGYNKEFGVLRPWFGLEWYHEFEDDQNILAAKYAQEDVLAASTPGFGFSNSLTGCLSCFSIAAAEPDTDFGVAGIGLSIVLPNFVQLLFYYEGLLGYEDLTSNSITFNFRSQF
ncbi:MAG TPA: autotransporter outer membrane beta-barrel domain-containing protein [Woeseiaceae bacterium]|nr:autotransporter outer membrane beta-barrel domain-containing protein [Woeseiaceae bacterium]